jgi:ABC-type sugar transport system ATPase subunit
VDPRSDARHPNPSPTAHHPSPITRPLLTMEGMAKSFGGVRALRDGRIEVRPGEVHALLGENGAGKSTLVKIIAGAHQPDGGTIRWDGEEIAISSLADAARRGIRVIYQQLNVVPHLTVAQNLTLGQERSRFGFIDLGDTRRRAETVLGRLGITLDLDRPAGELRIAERQLIEIARSLSDDVRLLVMDEPTASLGDREVERLFAVIRGLRERGIAIVYISHKLDDVFAIADRITVLRDGQTVGTVEAAETTSAQLISLMVGRTLGHNLQHASAATDEIVLEVDHLVTNTGLDDVSFTLHAGEVLGVYGLLGSGRTELARALFGADPIASGTVRVRGEPVRFRSPGDAKRAGLGFVPEERAAAAFPALSVRENLLAAAPELISRGSWLQPSRERPLAQRMVEALRVRTASIEEPLARLSGGNQQKVIVGRWLVRETPILILDDPTSGVDVGAKDELYRLIGTMTAAGTSVIISSSELPELLALADRMLVLHEGRVAGILEGAALTQHDVLQLAVQGAG